MAEENKEEKKVEEVETKVEVEAVAETKSERIKRLRDEQRKLIRVVVRCNNDDKKEWTGQTITVICAAGTINASSPMDILPKDIKDIYFDFIDILNICSQKEVKRFIFISSGGTVYGNNSKVSLSESDKPQPLSIYALQKVYFEYLINIYSRNRALNYVILRLSNPYGGRKLFTNNQGIIPKIINSALLDKPINLWVNPKKVKRDFIYIDDLLSAIGCIIKDQNQMNEIYNIGSGIATSMQEIIDIVEGLLDKKVLLTFDKKISNKESVNFLNIEKSCTRFNYKPKFNIKSGIKLVIESLKNHENI